MTLWDGAVLASDAVLGLAVTLGLLVRRHVRASLLLPVYVAAVAVPDLLMVAAPQQFFKIDFWLFKEALQVVVKVALALELSARVFASLPRARLRIVALQLAILATTIAVATRTLLSASWTPEVGAATLAWLHYGTAFLFASVLAGAIWYNVPLYPIHRVVLFTLTL